MEKKKRIFFQLIVIAVLVLCSACTTKKETVGDSTDVNSTSVNSGEAKEEEDSQTETPGEDKKLTVYPLYLQSLEKSADDKYFTAVTDDHAIMYLSNTGSEGTSYTMKLYSFDENGDCTDLIIKEIYPSEETMQYALSNESNYIDASEEGFTAADFEGADENVKNSIAISETVIYKHAKDHNIPKAKEQLIEDLQSYIDSAPMASYTDYAIDSNGGAFSSEDSEFGFWFSKEVIKESSFKQKGEGPKR